MSTPRASAQPQSGFPSGRALLHPIALVALAALIANDHWLKAAFPGWWTGKLSDVAGLTFFPLLVAAALELITRRPFGGRRVAIIAIAVGVGFAAIKLSAPAAEAYRVGLAAIQWPFHAAGDYLAGESLPRVGRVQLARDATDLLALPALLVPIVLARRAARGGARANPPTTPRS